MPVVQVWLSNFEVQLRYHEPLNLDDLFLSPTALPWKKAAGIQEQSYQRGEKGDLCGNPYPDRPDLAACPQSANWKNQINGEKQRREIYSVWPHWAEGQRDQATPYEVQPQGKV